MHDKDKLRGGGGFEAFSSAVAPARRFQARILKTNLLRRPKNARPAGDKGAVPLFAADILETQSLSRWPAPPGAAAATPSPGGTGRFDWRFSGKGRGGAE